MVFWQTVSFYGLLVQDLAHFRIVDECGHLHRSGSSNQAWAENVEIDKTAGLWLSL